MLLTKLIYSWTMQGLHAATADRLTTKERRPAVRHVLHNLHEFPD